jgi:hypothetical protein
MRCWSSRPGVPPSERLDPRTRQTRRAEGRRVIRVVPTGDLGLDVLLGGGWCLVKRFEGRESATVVVRGGSGVGKTLVSIQVAQASKHSRRRCRGWLRRDLPTEYIAQLQSARPALALSHVAMLPARAPAALRHTDRDQVLAALRSSSRSLPTVRLARYHKQARHDEAQTRCHRVPRKLHKIANDNEPA